MDLLSTPLLQLVDADPRVVAARAALDAFNASEAGRAVDDAYRGENWREKAAALDDESAERYSAHSFNYHDTRARVRRELAAERDRARAEHGEADA